MPTVDAAQAFEKGERGTSLRGLPILGSKPLALHYCLLERGFKCSRLVMPAERARDGSPRWRDRRESTPTLQSAAAELVYTHPDGGVVRIFPERGPTPGF